jgi:hypothetical protein
MPFTFSILFKSKTYGNSAITQKLSTHRFHGCIRCFKRREIHERETFRRSCFWVSHDFRRFHDNAEG